MDMKSKKGVTLVEVVTAVAIMAIILVPVSLVFTTAYSNFTVQSDKVTAQQSARQVLFGKNVNLCGIMNGIMGDLERSDAASSKIDIGDGSTTTASSISIHYKDDTGKSGTKKYSLNGNKLDYSDSNIKPSNPSSPRGGSVDYFNGEKSPNDKEVNVTDFVVEKVNKITDTPTGTDKKTDTDLIRITVTVLCGRSGDITLQSSYRIPNIERP